jgi:hypothetical protein
MKPIDKNIVKLKNLIGIIENPTFEDLLYEIVAFLESESNFEGEFKIRDVFLKTRVRLSSDLYEDVDKLVEMGYLEKLKYSNYKVIKHLWETSI